MDKAIELFDKVMKQGAFVMFLHERLKDPKEELRRIQICRMNDGGCYNKKRDRCQHCKCYMEAKTKMLKHKNPDKGGRIEITHCPLAKWGGEQEKEIANYYRKLDGKELLT